MSVTSDSASWPITSRSRVGDTQPRQQAGARPASAHLAGLFLELGHRVGARLPPGRAETEQHRAHADRTAPSTISTRASGVASSWMVTGRRLASDVPTSRVAHQATNVASTPPTSDSAKPSVSSCRTIAQAAAAEREPDRELLAPRAAPREEHVGEIERRDEQHEARHREEQNREDAELAVGLRARAHRHARERRHRERLILVLSGERPLERRRRPPRAPARPTPSSRRDAGAPPGSACDGGGPPSSPATRRGRSRSTIVS